jgi:hypothetical protein
MKSLFLSLCLLTLASSCKENLCPEGEVDSCLTPEAVRIDPSPEADGFDVEALLVNFKNEDQVKVESALELIKDVVRGSEFKERVINFTYNGKRAFVDNGGLTNEEIYQKILEGSEELNQGVDYKMDLELELYSSSKSTVGYTYESSPRIWMNTKFFDVYEAHEVAGNIFHEWTHKLGFDHASSYSVARDSSVPYALGYLMEELGRHRE